MFKRSLNVVESERGYGMSMYHIRKMIDGLKNPNVKSR